MGRKGVFHLAWWERQRLQEGGYIQASIATAPLAVNLVTYVAIVLAKAMAVYLTIVLTIVTAIVLTIAIVITITCVCFCRHAPPGPLSMFTSYRKSTERSNFFDQVNGVVQVPPRIPVCT